MAKGASGSSCSSATSPAFISSFHPVWQTLLQGSSAVRQCFELCFVLYLVQSVLKNCSLQHCALPKHQKELKQCGRKQGSGGRGNKNKKEGLHSSEFMKVQKYIKI